MQASCHSGSLLQGYLYYIPILGAVCTFSLYYYRELIKVNAVPQTCNLLIGVTLMKFLTGR